MKISKYNKIISANWKMNGSLSLIDEFEKYFKASYKHNISNAIIIFPPAPYFQQFSQILKNYQNIYFGSQNCSEFDNSARTGEISASIINDIGCEFVILGHSERRSLFNEDNSIISKKINIAIKNKLKVILCIGENQEQKDNSDTFKIIEEQIITSSSKECNPENTIIAYEPVWSIGSGKTPSIKEIEEINKFIQEKLKLKFNIQTSKFKIIYGGSVNIKNFSNILQSNLIDGVLIGGSSLNIKDFIKISNF